MPSRPGARIRLIMQHGCCRRSNTAVRRGAHNEARLRGGGRGRGGRAALGRFGGVRPGARASVSVVDVDERPPSRRPRRGEEAVQTARRGRRLSAPRVGRTPRSDRRSRDRRPSLRRPRRSPSPPLPAARGTAPRSPRAPSRRRLRRSCPRPRPRPRLLGRADEIVLRRALRQAQVREEPQQQDLAGRHRDVRAPGHDAVRRRGQGPEQGQGGNVRGGNDDGDRSLGGGGPGRRRGGGVSLGRRARGRRARGSRSVRRVRSIRPLRLHPRETVQAHDDDGDGDGTLGGTPAASPNDAPSERSADPAATLSSLGTAFPAGGAATSAVRLDPFLLATLRPHQLEGVRFMYESVMGLRRSAHSGAPHFGCLLAHEPGTGKTLQVVALLWTLLKQGPRAGHPAARKAVVACPASLVGNWGAEFRKWLGGTRLEPLLVEGGDACARGLLEDWALPRQRRWSTLVASYETLRTHADLVASCTGRGRARVRRGAQAEEREGGTRRRWRRCGSCGAIVASCSAGRARPERSRGVLRRRRLRVPGPPRRAGRGSGESSRRRSSEAARRARARRSEPSGRTDRGSSGGSPRRSSTARPRRRSTPTRSRPRRSTSSSAASPRRRRRCTRSASNRRRRGGFPQIDAAHRSAETAAAVQLGDALLREGGRRRGEDEGGGAGRAEERRRRKGRPEEKGTRVSSPRTPRTRRTRTFPRTTRG